MIGFSALAFSSCMSASVASPAAPTPYTFTICSSVKTVVGLSRLSHCFLSCRSRFAFAVSCWYLIAMRLAFLRHLGEQKCLIRPDRDCLSGFGHTAHVKGL